jgi:hypothetical protein
MTNKDWILMILALADGAALTPSQIEKALFLIQHQMPAEISDRPAYEFVPFQQGPYSPQVTIDAFELECEKFAASERFQARGKIYRTTMTGSIRALTMRCDLSPEALAYAQKIVAWIRTAPIATIVQEINRQFPQYQKSGAYLTAA